MHATTHTTALAIATALLFACGPRDEDPDPVPADTSDDTADTSDDADTSDVADTIDDDAETAEGIAIEGLSAETDVYFDAYGVLHARCATDADCAAVLGYFHARDRFAQMDLRRRVTTGRITDLVGTLALDSARANRPLFTTPTGEPIEDALLAQASDETVALLEAYARGVNAWIDDYHAERNGAALQDEYASPLIPFKPIDPWRPEDSLAAVAALVDSLTNDSGVELRNGQLAGELDPDTMADLFAPRPASASSTLTGYGADEKDLSDLDAARLRQRMRALAPLMEEAADRMALHGTGEHDPEHPTGSNNWIVSPSQARGDDALLANDPHLGLTNPSVWYIANLEGDQSHVAGYTFAGVPWVLIGQNEHVAWGLTTTYMDLSDVYVETLSADGEAVLFNGEEVPFTERDFTVNIGGGDPVTETFRYVPHHGPVLAYDADAGLALSLRWTGNLMTTDVNVFTLLARATDLASARDAASRSTSFGQNFVIADTAGDIGWYPFNNVPLRPWASAALPTWAPIPGTGEYEWEGYYALDDLPQATNPEAGYLATANNDMTGALADGDATNDGYPVIQSDAANGFRHERIMALLEEGAGDHDAESMRVIAADTFSLAGEAITPLILAAADAHPDALSADANAVVSALSVWSYTCPTGLASSDRRGDLTDDPVEMAESAGCTAFHVLFTELFLAAFSDEVAAEGWSRWPRLGNFYRLVTAPETLRVGDAWWDDVATTDVVETRDDIALRALETAATWLVDTYSADPATWAWGAIHTVTLHADLFSAFTPAFDNGPYANDGALWTVDVAAPSAPLDHAYDQVWGPSMRMVCETGATGVRCNVQMPGGQRHDRDSPHYEDWMERWLSNTPVPLTFDVAEAAASAEETLTISPR